MATTPDQPVYTVTFLLDRANNWMESHLVASGLLAANDRFQCRIAFEPETIRDQDIVFILSYTKILPPSFLQQNRLNLVIHASDLPRGKGFAPVQWQVLAGADVIPVCLIEAGEKVDAGDIILRHEIRLEGHELYEELRTAQAQACCALVREFLAIYPHFTRTRQEGEETFYPRRRPADAQLDVDKTIREQFNLLRIGNNEGWPSFFVLNGQKYTLKIDKAE